MNVEDDGRLYSVFMVEANNQEIDVLALIDAEGNILTSAKVNVEEPTQIAYEYTGSDNSFNCELVAINEGGQKIYYYGYERGDNQLSDDEYKWYSY